jgi:hypothetical protein
VIPPPVERVTGARKPQAPRDVSLDTLPDRWAGIEAVYRAERIREHLVERGNRIIAAGIGPAADERN